jgi:hypothetical protein
LFNSIAAARADKPASSVRTGRSALARKTLAILEVVKVRRHVDKINRLGLGLEAQKEAISRA